MIYDLASVVLSVAILVLFAHLMLAGRRPIPRWLGRGAGMVAAAIVLTLAERLFPGSPFRDWSFVLLRVGLLVCLIWAIRADAFPSRH